MGNEIAFLIVNTAYFVFFTFNVKQLFLSQLVTVPNPFRAKFELTIYINGQSSVIGIGNDSAFYYIYLTNIINAAMKEGRTYYFLAEHNI